MTCVRNVLFFVFCFLFRTTRRPTTPCDLSCESYGFRGGRVQERMSRLFWNVSRFVLVFCCCNGVVAALASGGSRGTSRRDALRRVVSSSTAAGGSAATLVLLAPAVEAFVTDPSEGEISSTPLDTDCDTTVRVPLYYVPRLSAYVVYYFVAGERFGAIVDTGSPFLMVPSYCNQEHWGCYRPADSEPSGLERTYERFDNNQGWVEWRRGPFAFADATGSSLAATTNTRNFIFGVLGESLMNGSGGVFMGLIRDTDAWIRPSFLGQTNVRSFQIKLAATPENSRFLTLSRGNGASLLISEPSSSTGYIPLIRDLNRRFKDPASHYTARATALRVNGKPLLERSKYPIYVIFDTGVSGMVVTSEVFEERYAVARQNREKSLWGSVEIDLTTHPHGQVVSLTAQGPVTTPFGERPWPTFKNAHLIVIGLAFLEGHTMTVDIDQQKLWFE